MFCTIPPLSSGRRLKKARQGRLPMPRPSGRTRKRGRPRPMLEVDAGNQDKTAAAASAAERVGWCSTGGGTIGRSLPVGSAIKE